MDGSSRGNPGIAGYALVVKDKGTVIHEESAYIGNNYTNNEAEYFGMLKALEKLQELNPTTSCVIYSDSELVVNQLNGKFKINSSTLITFWSACRLIIDNAKFKLKIKYIPREENARADALAQACTKERKDAGVQLGKR